MKCEPVLNHFSLLGEGPVWDRNMERIIWVDILRGNINQFHPASGTFQCFNVGQMIGAVTLRKGGGLVAALQHGFAFIDIEKEWIGFISDPEQHLPNNRFNDGKCDPEGRFWAGTMSVKGEEKAGSLYALEPDHSISLKVSGIGCSNGLAWSPDHAVLYYIDTPTKQVAAYDYDQSSGLIMNKRIVIEIKEENVFPDGMAIDEEGMLWVALWNGWRVERWNPYTGKLLQQISLPVSRVTSCTFGGESLEDLYMTTAMQGLSPEESVLQPLAGALFVIRKCGHRGIPAVEFAG